MEKKKSSYTSVEQQSDIKVKSRTSKGGKGDSRTKPTANTAATSMKLPSLSSHTQYFEMDRHEEVYKRIRREEFYGITPSTSGSSESFGCVHPEGRSFTPQAALARGLRKNLDPIPVDLKWTESCPPTKGWDIVEELKFVVSDPVAIQFRDRLESHLLDLITIAKDGYRISSLNSLSVVIEYMVETAPKDPSLRKHLIVLLENISKPILLTVASDIITYFDELRHYIGFLGYLLLQLEDDSLFDLVSKGILWQLSAPNSLRGASGVRIQPVLTAGAPVLHQSTVRMLAMSSSYRFPTFIQIALLLAFDSVENCVEMMKENIIENIMYRFNPYFPNRPLPLYDVNPANPQDVNVKLGDSSINMGTTLSLLLILMKTVLQYLKEHPDTDFGCPDSYAQRCFIWAYRYECRAREHSHERLTLTVIITCLLKIFKIQLSVFSANLMADILSLSVKTELPLRSDWTASVNFDVHRQDAIFKTALIHSSVYFFKTFPANKFMAESRHWIVGLMYLLDPGLCVLRAHWSSTLYSELRKTAIQAMICTLPLIPYKVCVDCGLIRRIMWYVEWYSESPYELPILYWCLRLLQVAVSTRGSQMRSLSVKDLYDTHGVIILIHLCYTLMTQKLPVIEKSQVVMALILRLITSVVESKSKISCVVYPSIKWPPAAITLARKLLDLATYGLQNHYIVNDRWLISILNYIWEAIIWNDDYRTKFIANNGIYKLLDLITMTAPAVQCIALALVSDVLRAGDAVPQLVTWRANLEASNAYKAVVQRGATIATLLASIFRHECKMNGIKLDEKGVIDANDVNPLMARNVKEYRNDPDFAIGKHQRTPICLAAADLAGSRMSKAFAILHLLSEDLEYKVSLADDAYNLYKNVKLSPEDETVLILCSHYLTFKLCDVWSEVAVQNSGLLPADNAVLAEFLQMNKGWVNEIRRQQMDVLDTATKKSEEDERSLYLFLGRVRLNTALDALREVSCGARLADREQMFNTLLRGAVQAHHRRSVFHKLIGDTVQQTYLPPLDDQNITGQNIKIQSIRPKNVLKKERYPDSE